MSFMHRNLRLILAYDGTAFHGWQRSEGVRTVQLEVELTLQRILQHPLAVAGASRTDSGVHARGQTAHVLTSSTIPLENIRRATAHHLPPDVALVHVSEAALDFNASRGAISKTYRYRVYASGKRPVETHLERYAWHVWYPLDDDRLRAAAALLAGTHDFAGFASQGSPRPSTVRTVHHVQVTRIGRELQFDVEGNGFLYNQVRNMVGTLIEVGRGHWPVERISEILAARDRRLAGATAPAHGLSLQWIRYGASKA